MCAVTDPRQREYLLSKPELAQGGFAGASRVSPLSPRSRSVRRLQLVSIVLMVVSLTIWLTTNLVQGHLDDELRDVSQWSPTAVTVVASLAIFLIARRPALSSAWIIRAGLVYEVIISFAITFGSSYGAYWQVAADELSLDRVGLSWVIPWMLFFTVLVQAPVREAAGSSSI